MREWLARLFQMKGATYLLFIFASAIFISTLGWILVIYSAADRFDWALIATLHRENPVLYIFDALPIAVLLPLYALLRRYNASEQRLRSQIDLADGTISRNADFATQIGQGNFTYKYTPYPGDLLGMALMRMRDNLLLGSQRESEASWIAKGKDEVAYMLRLHSKIDDLAAAVLRKLIECIDVVQGTLFLYDENKQTLTAAATYAYAREKYLHRTYKLGEGLVGECAYELASIYRTEIPPSYVTISSGILGDQKPRSILLVPLITSDNLQGVIEFASVREEFSERDRRFLDEVGEIIARTIFNLRVSFTTETLLHESQQLTSELRANEDILRQNAEEMQRTHEELAHTNTQLESKIREAENAQRVLHSLLENASEVIAIYNQQHEITYISPSVTKILGYTPEEMMDGKDHERLTQQGVALLDQMFENLLAAPMTPRVIQYIFMKKSGEKVSLEVTGRNMIDDPAIRGLVLNTQDITERLRAEKEERMKSRMQSLSENSLDMILRLSLDGYFHYANPMVSTYLGCAPSELHGKSLVDLALPESLSQLLEKGIADVKETLAKWEQEVRVPIKDGEAILRLNAIPEFDDGALETILFVGHDITEAKRIEFEIQDKSRKITESIHYAQRIQSAILPDIRVIQQYFPKSFMYYRPRDVVSGDFPWFFRKDDYLYIAAVDCTGHGVPGALLSFIGYFTLNNVVDHDSSYSASQVLDLLHQGVRSTLRQDRSDSEAHDGMDIALLKVHLKGKRLEFSGAHRPLYHVRNGELTEFKGDRKAIGGIPLGGREVDFTNHVIEIETGDRVYFFSDGLPDQLGGDRGVKKYSPQHIREVLVTQHALPMPRMHDFISKDFALHRGAQKQLDDVLLIGIEF